MTIKAIETKYKGYRFRSRLEARWAVFFDAIGIEWLYECEGFEKELSYIEDEDGNEHTTSSIRYLPDFFLTKSETWVEVKPTDDALKSKSDDMEFFLDHGSPLPNFEDSYNRFPNYGTERHGLLFLSEIPNPADLGFHGHPIVRHSKGLHWNWAFFHYGSLRILDSGEMNDFVLGKISPDEWTVKSCFARTNRYYKKVLDAYAAARSARFEHGECG